MEQEPIGGIVTKSECEPFRGEWSADPKLMANSMELMGSCAPKSNRLRLQVPVANPSSPTPRLPMTVVPVLIYFADNKGAVVSATFSPQVLDWIGSAIRKQPAKSTERSAMIVYLDVGDCCKNPRKAVCANLLGPISTSSKVLCPNVDSAVTHDLSGQGYKPDNSVPKNPKYTELTTLIADELQVHTNTRKRELRSYEQRKPRRLGKLPNSFKVLSSAQTSLLGVQPKPILPGGTIQYASDPTGPHRDSLRVRQRQNVKETKRKHVYPKSLKDYKSRRPKDSIAQATGGSLRKFRPKEKKLRTQKAKDPRKPDSKRGETPLQTTSGSWKHQGRKQTTEAPSKPWTQTRRTTIKTVNISASTSSGSQTLHAAEVASKNLSKTTPGSSTYFAIINSHFALYNRPQSHLKKPDSHQMSLTRRS
ncbi:hypothetical protein CLF_104243 [Clonorchis sinensis]|uniref:Uncharacterized protein n=1 Tax=Clonorchis sinensis TaxID=79923 RepID=G7YB80_CLOSI|nr:hypothetical protein CLF_104243 [Clonorchis sinensis]